jgi:uncharacterized Zn finger protein
MPRWRDFDDFPPSKPIAVQGGIKAHSKRGAFAAQWWARRWIAALEALNVGGRLERGRSYARKGQVVSLDIAPGKVTAAVQGSRPRPYAITIGMKPIAAKDWKALGARFAESPLHLAKLLAGEMPEDIEGHFADAGLSLFPARASELQTDCSCPDWSNPCKHIAAVYYLLGEEFDRDPFLIFRLRGITREELSALVGSGQSAAPVRALPAIDPPATALLVAGQAPPEHFWEGTAPSGDLFGNVEPSAAVAPILRRLGGFPFWRGESDFFATLEPLYTAAAATALAAFAGEREAPAPPTLMAKTTRRKR